MSLSVRIVNGRKSNIYNLNDAVASPIVPEVYSIDRARPTPIRVPDELPLVAVGESNKSICLNGVDSPAICVMSGLP